MKATTQTRGDIALAAALDGFKQINDAAQELHKGSKECITDILYEVPLEELLEDYESGILSDFQTEVIEERIQWRKMGRCDHCGDRVATENNGFNDPFGPDHIETYCKNLFCSTRI